MSSFEKIGKIISKTSEKADFEWEITDFLSYTEADSQYFSPEFHLLNSTWKIEIRPNGKISDNSTGNISLYLHRIDEGASKSVDFTFGLKAVNQLIENVKRATWKTDEDGWGFGKFIERSKLLQKKQNLVPSENLIVVCTLTIKGGEKELSGDESRHENLKELSTATRVLLLDESKIKLVADFKDMFVSKKNTDVIIKVKEETFLAHRLILAARSPVLAAMFENKMIESETGFVDISDCDPEAFHHFLLYLYSGELDSEKCDFFHLYKIADKYVMPELKLICIDFIIHNISVENFCDTYVFGHQFNESKLLTKIHNFFNDNFEKIVSSDTLLALMKEDCDLANNLLKAIVSKVKIEK